MPLPVAFDTETTGLDHKRDRIVEVAALYFDPETGEIADQLHCYVNPGIEVSAESIAVHGLTNEFLADKPSFAEVAEQVIQFCSGRDIVIHNAPFDTRFMDEEFKRAKVKTKLAAVGSSVIDTLAMSRKAVKAKKHTLDVLCDRFGVDRSKRTLHGALVDCELLAYVYPHLHAEYTRVMTKLSEMLSRPIGAPMPSELEDKVLSILELKTLTSVLEAETKRLTEAVKEQVEGLPVEGDGWQVRFQGSTATDWDKIKETLLQGVDLRPYQTPGSKMYVERID